MWSRRAIATSYMKKQMRQQLIKKRTMQGSWWVANLNMTQQQTTIMYHFCPLQQQKRWLWLHWYLCWHLLLCMGASLGSHGQSHNNFKLPDVWEHIIVTTITKKDVVHDDLCHQPNMWANVKRQFGIGLFDICSQLVKVVRICTSYIEYW